MKRESNDSNSKDGLTGGKPSSEPNSEPRGWDGALRDGSPAGPDASPLQFSLRGDGSLRDLNSWEREDFEAALPLYVGGELDSAEAKRVDAWLAAHPEDQTTLAASEAAAGVLARYAEIARQRETPDLWAGIRGELVRGNVLSESTERIPVEAEAPILGGPRWFQRKGVAAAAAILLTASVGMTLLSRSVGREVTSPGPSFQAAATLKEATVDQPRAAATAAPVAASPSGELRLASHSDGSPGTGSPGTGSPGTVGQPLEVTLVRKRSLRTQPLSPAGPDAERLIDDAEPWLFWQRGAVVRPANHQLTSGGR